MRLNSFFLTFCFLAVCFVASTRAIDLENIPSPYPTSGAAINGVIPDPELNFEQIWFYGSVILDTVATSIAWDAPQEISTTIDEVLFPCQYHLYRLDASQFTDYVPGDYLHIEVEYRNDLSDNTGLHFPLTGEDYIQLYVSYDSTGSNPPLDPSQPDFSTLIDELVPYQPYSPVTTTGIQYGNSNQIFYEITPCDMTDEGFFWIAVYNARGTDQLEYNIYLERRRPAGTCDILITTECLIESVTPITLGNIVATSDDPLIIAAGATRKYINDTRANEILQQFDITIDSASSLVMSDPEEANIPMHYRYFSVDFSAYERTGVYAVINISQVEGTFAWFYNWGSVPFTDGDATTCGTPGPAPGPYCSPVNVNFTWETTSLILEPCDIQFDQLLYIGVVMGRSYFPLDLGSGNFGEFGTGIRATTFESEDFTSFEIDVAVYEPVVTSFSLGTPLRAVIPAVNLRAANVDIPDSANLGSGFFRLDLTDADFGPLSTLNFVIESNQESRVRFRFFDGTTSADQLTDFICYDCEPDYDEDTCTTLFEYVFCDSRLAAGTYFFLIEPSTPTDFTYVKLHAYITEKAIPSVLEAGIPAHNTLENGDYAYYVVNVPVLAEQNTWLYVELFALGYNAETSTDYATTLEVSMKAGQIPEDVCSQVEADWKCTLDISEFSGMSTNACNFFVDACFLEAGPFYITVHSIDNSDVGDAPEPSRSVDVPGLKSSATYTLWAEFESAVELQNNVTYSDIVLTNQYNHYYIKVDEVVQGSWFTVEVDNAQTGFSSGDSTYNVFLNYGSLAGACPCYDSLYNCTGNLITAEYCAGEDSAACTPETDHNLDLIDFSYDTDSLPFDLAPEDDDADLSCCKLYADGCDFRAGTWYISVLNSPNGSPNTKEEYVVDVIGYTITAIIHPPPPVFELAVETPVVDWIDPDSFNHYIVDTDYVYGADLAVKVTWMQDACFREIGYDEKVNGGFKAFWLTPHTISEISYAEESVQLRLSGGSLALPECYNLPWSCSVPGRDEQTGTYSSCTVVIPNCEWSKLSSNGPLFASVGYLKFNGGVFGNYAQVTIEVSIEKEYVSDLTIGVPVTSWIAQNRYHHYSFPVDPALIPNSRLEIQAYFNHFTSQTYSHPFSTYAIGEPTLSLQFDRRAGGVRACPDCFDNYLSHSDTSSIHWSLDPCTVQARGAVQYYLSVYNPTNSFFDQSLEYTLSVWTEEALTVLDFSELWPAPSVEFAPSEIEYNIKFNSGDDHYQLLSGRHYRFNFPIPAILDSDYVRLAVRAVTDVEIYLETNALAGPTCCYTSYCYHTLSGSGEQSCSEDVSAWEIIFSATELRAGNDYYLFVRADESADADPTHIFLRAEFYSLGTFDNNNHVITGTTSESIQFNLGHESEETLTTYNFDLNHVDAYIGEYNEGYNFDEWLTDGANVNHWNSANLWRNETVLAGRYRFHPITITTGRVDQVFFGLDNVYQNYCDSSDDTDTILNLYYLGCGETVAELLPTPDQCPSGDRRDVVLTDDWIYNYLTNELPEVGASSELATSYSLVRLDSCSASCSGTHWIAAVASDSVVAQLGDAGFLPTITYDLHIFLQSPIPLPEYNDIEADLNSTLPAILTGDYNGWRQRYILSDSTMTTGVLPMTEIVLEKNYNIFTDITTPFFFNLRIEIYKDETASYDDASGCCAPSPDNYERRAGLGSIDMTNANCFPSVVVGDDIILGCGEIASLSFYPDDICPPGAADCLITILPCQLDNSVWYIDITSSTPNINSDVSPYQIYYNVLSDRFPTGSLDYDVADIFERNIVPDPTVNPILLSGMDNFHFFKVDIAEYVAAGPYVDNAAFRGRLEIQVYYESFTSCTVNCGDAAAVTFISYSNGTGFNDAPPVVPGFSNWTDFAIYGNTDNWDGFIACDSSYTCFTEGGDNECSSLSQIFVVPECELKPTDSFWITTRLLIPGDVGLRFQVRIVEPVCDPTSTGHSCTDISSPVDADSTVDSLTTSADPVEFFGTDGASDGIEPGTWVHHRFAIDSSVTEDQTVEIVLTNDYTTVATTSLPGDIYLRISRYAVAQNPDAASDAIDTLTGRDSQGYPIDTYCADTSLPPIFACSIDGSTGGAPTDDRCYIQIPSTRFEAGAIYFASLYYDIHYHDHDTDDLTDPVNAVNPYEHYKGYNISIFVKDFNPETFTVTGASNGFIPSQCTGDISSTPGVRELGNDIFDNGFFPSDYLSEAESGFFGIYEYYSITVSPDDLDLICTNDVTDTCLFEHTLIVNVENTDPVSTHLVGPINVLFYAPQSLLFNNEEQPSFVPRYYEYNYFPQNFYDADDYSDGVTTNYIFTLADSVDANATIAYTACPSYNGVALRPGTYYIVVQTQIDNDYEICAYLDRTDYIPPGTGAFTSIADADVIFGDVSVFEILSDSHSAFVSPALPVDDYYYRFRIEDSDLTDGAYLQIWLDDIISCDSTRTTCVDPTLLTPAQYPSISVFRDDCESWSADLSNADSYGSNYGGTVTGFSQYGFLRRIVIGTSDNNGYDSCGLDSGTYFIHVNSPGDTYDWVLEVYIRYPQVFPPETVTPFLYQQYLANNEIHIPSIYASIWQYQYQVYHVVPTTPTRFVKNDPLYAYITNTGCGTLQAWSKLGSPAGPGVASNTGTDTAQYCSHDSCLSITSGNDCTLETQPCYQWPDIAGEGQSIDIYYTIYGYEQTANDLNTYRGVELSPSSDFLENYYAPISYTFSVFYADYVIDDNLDFGCPQPLVFSDDSFTACLEDPVEPTLAQLTAWKTEHRFKWNVETRSLFSQLFYNPISVVGPSWIDNCDVSSDYPERTIPSPKNGDSTDYSYSRNFITLVPEPYTAVNPSLQRTTISEQGPVTVAPFIDGTQYETQAELSRLSYWVPTIYPGVVYSGSLGENGNERYAYYKFSNPADYEYFDFSSSVEGGLATFSVFSISECGSTDYPISEPLYNCFPFEDNLFLKVTFDVNGGCQSPCAAVEYTFSYIIRPEIASITCEDSYCFDDGTSEDTWWSFDSDVPAIFTSDTTLYGRIHNIESDAAYSTYDSTFCSSPQCPEYTGLFLLDSGATYLKIECESVEINTLTFNVQHDITPTASSGTDYYRFVLPPGDYSLVYDFGFTASIDCGEIYYYLRYEALPSEDCNSAFGTCNPAAGQYFVRVDYTFDINILDSQQIYSIGWFYNTFVTVEVDPNEWSQHTLLAGEVRLFQFDTSTVANTHDSYLQFDYVVNSDGSVDEVEYSDFHGLQLGYVSANFGLGSASNCYELGSTSDDVQPYGEDAFPYSRGIPVCNYEPGVYSIPITAYVDVTFSVNPQIKTIGITPNDLGAVADGVITVSESLSFSHFVREWHYYTTTVTGGDADVLTRYGQARLANVVGGGLRLSAAGNFFISESYDFTDITYNQQNILANNINDQCQQAYSCLTFDTYEAQYGTDIDEEYLLNNYAGSCAIVICPETYATWTQAFFAVAIDQSATSPQYLLQADPYQPVSYQLVISEHVPETLTSTPAHVDIAAFDFGTGYASQANRQAHFLPTNVESFFYEFSSEQSVKITVSVEGTHVYDGVLVKIFDASPCESCYSYFWCGAQYDEFLCEFEVSTDAEKLSGQYYVEVFANSITSFDISATEGLDNCEFPEASGSLDFCTGLVDYPVWQWTSYTTLDAEASCLYQTLVADFEAADCDILCNPDPLSFDCYQALQRFACYESFRPCDINGFSTSTCRAACQTVESQCERTFAGASHDQYSCTASRYIDDEDYPDLHCAGPLLDLTPRDTPDELPDVLTRFKVFKNQLLENFEYPEADPNFGFNLDN